MIEIGTNQLFLGMTGEFSIILISFCFSFASFAVKL